jgi:hypothetical protein
LGGAPLALGALGALAAARGALAGTAVRREKIQEQIAAQEAKKKLAAQQEVDAEGIIKAGIYLGAAGASLALIIANPFGGIIGDEFSLPSFSLPTITLPSGGSSTPAISETKPPSAADEARARIRADQAARLEEKRAINEAKRAEAAKKAPPPATKMQNAVVKKEVDSYESLFKKATSSGPQTSVAAKEAKVVKETKVAVSSATLGETDVKTALVEAKSLTASKAEPDPAPKVDTKVSVTAAAETVAKDAEEAIKKAEIEAFAAAKQLKIEEEIASKAAKEAAEIEKNAIEVEQKAIAAKEAEAVKKAAAADVKAKEVAEVAKATVKVDAKLEAIDSDKVVETTKAADIDTSSTAPSGGRVLPKEEVSAETMAFLKTLKK